MGNKRGIWCASAVAAAAIASGAAAQEAQEHGVRFGSFVATPQVTVDGRYSDNYLGLTSNEVDSFVYSVAPQLSFRSDWNRHALQVTLGGKASFVEADSDDNSYTYGIDSAGVIDVTRATAIKLSAGYQHNTEDRGADDSPGLSAEPTEFDTVNAGIEGRYKAGRVRLSPFASYLLSDYDDVDLVGGGKSNSDDRDRQVYGYGMEVGYEFLRGYEAYVRGEGNTVRYDSSTDDNGFNRDSDGYKFSGGVNLQLTNLIEGRVGVGYGLQDYDDSRFGSQEAINVDVGVVWSVTPLTTITVDGFQSFNETTTIGSAGTTEVGGQIGVSHSLRENITLSGYAGYSHEDFEGVAREDDRIDAGVKLGYTITRNFEIGVGYDFTFEDQKTVGDYTENQAYIGLTARY